MNKVEDVLSKTVSAQENSMASIRSMETQIGRLVKQMSQLTQTVEGKIGQFSANTTINPKEQCNNITTEGDEKTREENGEMVKVEKEKGKNKEEGDNCEIVEIAKEIFHRNIKKEKEGLFSDNLLPKNYFAGWPEKKTYFDEVRRKICCFKNKYGEKEARSSFSKTLPKKFRDPGSFTISVSIGNLFVYNALLDLGSSVNLMPLSMLRQIGNLEVKPTKMQLQLPDRTVKYPYGVVEDVLMQIDKFIFPVDFVILDMKEDEDVPLILGRPLMKTAKVIVDVDKGEILVRSHDEEVKFNLFNDVTKCTADETGKQEEIPRNSEKMKSSKSKEKVIRHEKLEAKGDNQGKLVEGEEYRPGQPIMLNVGRGRGRKKTRKLWVIKELKKDGKIEVEEPYLRRIKVITKARVEQDKYPP